LDDTIFALSSGSPPAAIGVIRISGPRSQEALRRLCGREIAARRASLVTLRDQSGKLLDRALALWFPGPASATGEDCVELHCHGGRAVIKAVERALGGIEGLRAALPGEFTRRAFINGRIDLAEAEGLADLLAAETELQRQAALTMAGGAFSRQLEAWRERVLQLSAMVESALDFSDEDDVSSLPEYFREALGDLAHEWREWLQRPRAERLGEGFRVVLAGPPNAGKSTLFNALIEDSAAITSPIAGTTRDVIERSVAISGIPFCFVDTAGLREASSDSIERTGVELARRELNRADLVLWLGDEGKGIEGAWEIESQCDREDHRVKRKPRHRVSAVTGEGIAALRADLIAAAREAMPKPGQAAFNARQHARLSEGLEALEDCLEADDPLILAEGLRSARVAIDRLSGRATTEDMLDALFSRFCIGK